MQTLYISAIIAIKASTAQPIKHSQPVAVLPNNPSGPLDFTADGTDSQIKTEVPYYFLPTIRPDLSDGYQFYLPQPEDYENANKYDVLRQDLQPPPISNEPNYYAVKPKKGTKKFNAQKKHININTKKTQQTDDEKNERESKQIDSPQPSVDYQYEDGTAVGDLAQSSHTQYVTKEPERKASKSIKTLRQDDFNTGEYLPKIFKNADDDRVAFQMHGFNGPNSYKFGYDTGKG